MHHYYHDYNNEQIISIANVFTNHTGKKMEYIATNHTDLAINSRYGKGMKGWGRVYSPPPPVIEQPN